MKKSVSIALVAIMLISMLSTFAFATNTDFAGGSGTESDPYLISNKTHLNNVCNYLDAHFKLMCDIEFEDMDFAEGGYFYNGGKGWKPIGTSSSSVFTGSFDGNGYSIKNLYVNISSSSTVYAGLFGYNKGVIKNLGMVDGDITAKATSSSSYSYAGGIAGYNSSGTITNCYNTGEVSASSSSSYTYVGGIAGYNENGTITNCYNTGDVSASSSSASSYAYAGGIVGYNSSGTITNCYNTGSVSSSDYAGGIAGDNKGTITNCYYPDLISKGVGSGTDNTTKCTLEQLKQQSTFVGFDFENIWTFDSTLKTYPAPVLKNIKHIENELIQNTTEFAGGTGTAFDPYLISNQTQLNNVRNYLGAHFKMIADIEFTDADFAEGGDFYNDRQGFMPIGTGSNHSFAGSFDGNGYSIKNLYVNISSSSTIYAGLFGYNKGVIKNLGMVDGDITSKTTSSYSYSYAGGIAGYNNGTITNCYNTGSVSASSSSSSAYASGIAGYNKSTITNCYNTGSVSASSSSSSSSSSYAYAGGIAGYNYEGTIKNCYNTGSISASSKSSSPSSSSSSSSSYSFAGGIAGYNSKTITNCYNTGEVSASSSSSYLHSSSSSSSYSYSYSYAYAGGIAGYNDDTITNCYNTGSVSSSSYSYSSSSYPYSSSYPRSYAYAGGIAGYNSKTITNCYNTGSISASSKSSSPYSSKSSSYSDSYAYAGGIAGYNDDTITNCYNTGSVSASSSSSYSYSSSSSHPHSYAYAGGIAGYNDDGTITNCYNTGSVSSSSSSYSSESSSYSYSYAYAGGIAGYNSSGTITNCYNTGEVSASSSSSDLYSSSSPCSYAYAGGIVGYNYGTIENCYNTGSVSASASSSDSCSRAGGIAGYNSKTITNCYNTGEVSVSSSYTYVGGIAGYNKGTITNCYYLDIISKGVGDGNDNTTKCTSEQLKQQSTFVGFDFNCTWEIDNTSEYKYPQLINIETVSVLNQPNNNTFIEGLNPDLTGATIKITYKLGAISKEKIVPITIDNLQDFNNNMIGSQKVYVKCSSFISTDTIDFVCVKKLVDRIEVTTLPSKLQYVQGQPIIVDGAKATVYYNNNTSDIIDISECTFDYDKTKVGTVPVTVFYNGFTDTFEITVTERIAKSMTLTAPTIVTNLQWGDINLDGGYIKVVFESDDNYSETIPLDMSMISGYDKNTLGYQNVTVTYAGKSKTFTVNVIERELLSISIETLPSKTTYHLGETANNLGLVVKANYNGATSKIITDYTISGFSTTTAGKKTITVSYEGMTDTFEITVEGHSYSKGYDSSQHWDECDVCHYKVNYKPHSYTNNCDTTCNGCDNTRVTEHKYDNDCDTDCNVCGVTRTITHDYKDTYNAAGHFEECTVCGNIGEGAPHEFDNACDTDCACGYTRITHHKYDNDFDAKCNICDAERTPHNTATRTFKDIKSNDWYKYFVDYAVAYGLFSGTSDTTFSPNTEMTRAQFVQVLANLSGVSLDNTVDSGFTDVPSGQWYTGAVKWAVENGVASGVGSGKFDPNSKVTREQMCVMLVNYIEKYLGATLEITTDSTFTDDSNISGWAKTAVYKCFSAGLVSGTGNNNFSPKAIANRAQGATIFTNFHKAYIA